MRTKVTEPIKKALKDNISYLGWFRWEDNHSKRKMGILRDKNLKALEENKDTSGLYDTARATLKKCNEFYAKIINDCVFRKEEALALWKECKEAAEDIPDQSAKKGKSK